MPTITDMVFGNSILDWVLGGLVTLVSLAVLPLLKKYVLKKLRRLATRTKTDTDDLLVEVLGSTRGFALLVFALFMGVSMLTLPEPASKMLRHVFMVLLFLQGALWGNAAIAFFQNRFTLQEEGKEQPATGAVRALTGVARIVVWGLAVLLVLDNLGANITGLVAGLGIGGIAVALALQNILGDLFASLSILLDKPFVNGDFVVVDSFLGTIEHIGLKSTRLRSLSGEQIIVANADLLRSRIRNFKRMNERRVVLAIDVTYQTPHSSLVRAIGIIRDTIRAQEATRFDRAHFKEFGPSSLRLEAVYFVLDPDFNRFMDIQQAVNLRLLEQFAQEGIEFAYPTQTVVLQNGSAPEAEPGNTQDTSGQQSFGMATRGRRVDMREAQP
jgi:small-conductance mechanosensitive channel